MSAATQETPRARRKSLRNENAAAAEQQQTSPASASAERGGAGSAAKADAKTPTKGNGVKNEDDGSKSDKSKKRRKVNHACLYCRRSHMTCDQARPCSRCVKRRIAHLCHDEPRSSKKGQGSPDGTQFDEPTSPAQDPVNGGMNSPEDQFPPPGALPLNLAQPAISPVAMANPAAMGPTPVDGEAPQLFPNPAQPFYNDWDLIQHQNSLSVFNTSEAHGEYNVLNDFLTDSLNDDGNFYPGEYTPARLSDPSLFNITGPMGPISMPNAMFEPPAPTEPLPQQDQQDLVAAGNEISRPGSRIPISKVDKAQEKYYTNAADPPGTAPPEERMNRLMKEKYDAGLLKPFNYVKGYARMQQYMEKHMHPNSRQRILRQLDAFRPKFRERMQSLTDIELVRVEMWFERKLMEYDRVFASMAIPACCWRRTGEIFRGNKGMAELIQVPVERLREGKLAIHEILGEESIVCYWEKFGAIAFDHSQKGILTSCSLKSPVKNAPEICSCDRCPLFYYSRLRWETSMKSTLPSS